MLNLEIKIKLLQQRHKTEDETVMRLFYIVAIGCHIMLSMLCLRLVVMTYWNPIEKYGVEKFAQAIADNGGSGVITPDLTIEESTGWLAATAKAQINPIYVVAPSTKDARLAEVTSKTSGFVYAASLMGVTGTRNSVSTGAADLVARVRSVTDLPISVGLGVSTREQAKSLAAYADGVIVGSAFIKLLLEAKSEQEGLDAISHLASELALGVREGR